MWSIGIGVRLGIGLILIVWVGGMLACSQVQYTARQQPPGRDFLIIGHRGAPNRAC